MRNDKRWWCVGVAGSVCGGRVDKGEGRRQTRKKIGKKNERGDRRERRHRKNKEIEEREGGEGESEGGDREERDGGEVIEREVIKRGWREKKSRTEER